MGNNAAYTEFERAIIEAYDDRVLDKTKLTNILERYRGMDVDHGGMVGLVSHDGLCADEIVVKVWGLQLPKRPDIPKDHNTWTDEQNKQNDEYWNGIGDMFKSITDQFEWW